MAEYVFLCLFCAVLVLVSSGCWRFISGARNPDAAVRKEARRKALIAAGCFLGAVSLLVVAPSMYEQIDLRLGDAGRYATRNDRTIELHPSKITFQVPQSWLDWDKQFHNNFHLSHRELRRVRIGHGKWDSEYAAVVNASLPFEECAAHVGGEGWGWQGVSLGDLQVRAYISQLSSEEVLSRVKKQGFAVAQGVAARQSGFAQGEKAGFSASSEQNWQHGKITYPPWYGDYGGPAPIDFYVKDGGKYRLVLVFMGWGLSGEAASILNSVVVPAGEAMTD